MNNKELMWQEKAALCSAGPTTPTTTLCNTVMERFLQDFFFTTKDKGIIIKMGEQGGVNIAKSCCYSLCELQMDCILGAWCSH